MSNEAKELRLIANMNTVLSGFDGKTLSAVSMDEHTTQCPVFSFTDGTAFHLDHQWSGRWYKGSQSWKGVEELKAFLPCVVTSASVFAPEGEFTPNVPFRRKEMRLECSGGGLTKQFSVTYTAFGMGQYPIEYVREWKGKAFEWERE